MTPIESDNRELLPVLTKRCRILAHLIRLFFWTAPLMTGIYAASRIGWFYGLLVWLASILAISILTGIIKQVSVPRNQHERSHSTLLIVEWYLFSRRCQ